MIDVKMNHILQLYLYYISIYCFTPYDLFNYLRLVEFQALDQVSVLKKHKIRLGNY